MSLPLLQQGTLDPQLYLTEGSLSCKMPSTQYGIEAAGVHRIVKLLIGNLVNITDTTGAFLLSGSFECGNVCERALDCGKHSCEKPCHAQDTDTAHCPFSPDVVTHCPCGKTSLSSLNCTRTCCEDEIPHCQEMCDSPFASRS